MGQNGRFFPWYYNLILSWVLTLGQANDGPKKSILNTSFEYCFKWDTYVWMYRVTEQISGFPDSQYGLAKVS